VTALYTTEIRGSLFSYNVEILSYVQSCLLTMYAHYALIISDELCSK